MIDGIKVGNQSFYPASSAYVTMPKKEEASMYTKGLYSPAPSYEVKQYTYGEQVDMAGDISEWESLVAHMEKEEARLYDLVSAGYDIENLTEEELNSSTRAIGKKTEKEISLKNKIERIKEETDSMYHYGMTSGDTITIASLYKGSYTGSEKRDNATYSKNQVNGVLNRNGLEQTDNNRWAAQKLMELGIDVTGSNVVKMQNLSAVVETLEEYAYSEDPLVDENTPLMEEEKILYTEKSIQEIVDELTAVEDGHIDQVIADGKEITIGNLREALLKGTQKALHPRSNQPSEGTPEGELVAESTTGKEVIKGQLKEIRAKLNVEAAIRISEKMPLESSQLAKVAEALAQIEEGVVTEALHKADLVPTEENKAAVTTLLHTVEAMRHNQDIVLEVEVETNEQATIGMLDKAVDAYWQNETVAERRFGESIKKVESQIPPMLEAIGVEATASHIASAKALLANELPITKESIEEVLPIVTKLETFLGEMTPYRMAELIKEGISPYDISVGEAVVWLGEKQVPQMKQSVAQMIVELVDKKQVTTEQKESLVGLYQLLDKVEKNKEGIAGYLLKNELPLTVERLQEATKYVGKQTVMERSVDDNTGELQSLKGVEGSIRSRIELADREVKRLVDVAKLLEQMEITPTQENKGKFAQIMGMIYPMIKAEVKKELGHFEGIGTLPSSFVEKVEAIKSFTPQMLAAMEESNIPVTISNMYWLQKITEDPSLYGSLLEENNLLEEGFPESYEELENRLEELSAAVQKQKDQAMEHGQYSKYKNYKQIGELVQLQRQLGKEDGHYQIPFIIAGEMRLVNLYVEKDQHGADTTSKDIKAIIRYETKNLGKIETRLQVQGDSITYDIVTDQKSSAMQLANHQRQIEEMIAHLGYGIKGATYQGTNEPVNAKAEQVKHKESVFEEII